MTNSWKALPFPTQAGQVGGHEGVGIVHKLGPGSEQSKIKVGDRVGIKVNNSEDTFEKRSANGEKWVASVCGSCAACYEGADGVCFVSIWSSTIKLRP